MNRICTFAAAITAFALAMGASSASAAGSGSDAAFDALIGSMAARDTGSAWFDHYVETVNQEVAFHSHSEPYGAAGPNGPLDGFNGYVAGFRQPDSGSRQFNNYVDAVNRIVQLKQAY